MGILDIKLFQTSKSFLDIYREKDDKCLLDSKCIWDKIWLWDSGRFQDVYRKKLGE